MQKGTGIGFVRESDIIKTDIAPDVTVIGGRRFSLTHIEQFTDFLATMAYGFALHPL